MTNTPPFPPPPSTDPQPTGGPPLYHGGNQPPAAPAPPPPYGVESWQPAGGAWPAYAAVPKGPKPTAVLLAQILMYVGAAQAVLNVILGLMFRDQVTEQIRTSSTADLTDAQFEFFVNVGLVMGAIIGLVAAGLWIFMAWANGAGMGWARILASVFFGMSVFSAFYVFILPNPSISRIFAVIGVVLGGAIIALLWLGKDTGAYFASRRPR